MEEDEAAALQAFLCDANGKVTLILLSLFDLPVASHNPSAECEKEDIKAPALSVPNAEIIEAEALNLAECENLIAFLQKKVSGLEASLRHVVSSFKDIMTTNNAYIIDEIFQGVEPMLKEVAVSMFHQEANVTKLPLVMDSHAGLSSHPTIPIEFGRHTTIKQALFTPWALVTKLYALQSFLSQR